MIIIYLFIRHIPYSTIAGSVQQCQEIRQEGMNKEKWIRAEGKILHHNPGK